MSIKAKAAARGLIGGGEPPKIAPIELDSYAAERARLARVNSDPNALSPVALPTNMARSPLGMLEGAWMVKRSAGTFKKSNRRWFTVDVPNARIAYYVISPSEKPGGLGLSEDDVRGGSERTHFFNRTFYPQSDIYCTRCRCNTRGTIR